MYTFDLPILYPENARGELFSGQHPNCFHSSTYPSRNTVPIGFFCGGFSSTVGYVPDNEAYRFRNKRLLLIF
jgi:hypothetical protein